MFRRSILALSSRRSILPRQITPPRVASLRKEFSTKPYQNVPPKPGDAGQQPESKSNLPGVILGGTALAGAALLAYRAGYLDRFMGEKQQVDHVEVEGTHIRKDKVPIDAEERSKIDEVMAMFTKKGDRPIDVVRIGSIKKVGTQTETKTSGVGDDKRVENLTDLPRPESEKKVEDNVGLAHDEAEKKNEAEVGVPYHQDVRSSVGEIYQAAEVAKPKVEDDAAIAPEEKHEPQVSAGISPETVPGINQEPTTSGERNEEVEVSVMPKEDDIKTVLYDRLAATKKSEAGLNKDSDASNLLDAYHLNEKTDERPSSEAPVEEGITGEINEGYVTKDGKLVMDFLQAIHAAEKRQAELDAQVFTEEKRALKEKYEKQLRDSRARELMLAEEAAMLDKEIKRERAKAAAAVRSVEEKMEEKLQIELEQKEAEAEAEVKRIQELAKAELLAAIASEKAAQIEKIAEANLNIDALCMAFFARSEEARQIHSVHKLALGALALEDALSQGLPIQKELEDLSAYLEGTDKDSLVQLVLSTLPEETRQSGTDTVLQLNQKFNALKGTLRHHILIPPGGGGILAHAMAQIASWLRLKEVDPSGDGIESVISKVQTLLSEGKLAEAADALQEGVRGSQAEQMAGDWVRRAKNRAITEQALTVLQSYATCISLTRS